MTSTDPASTNPASRSHTGSGRANRAVQVAAELTKPGGALDVGPDRARLMARLFQLLSRGPVTRARADAAVADLGIDSAHAHTFLEAWTERDDDGDIVGLGVTHNPTPHQVRIGDAHAWTWCAMDTLVLAIVLDTQVAVESTAPGTDGSGQTVRLTVRPDGVADLDPADAVITWPLRSGDQVDLSSNTAVWGTFCHHSYLFPAAAQAEQWASGRDDLAVMHLDEGFAVARHVAGMFLRHAHAGEARR